MSKIAYIERAFRPQDLDVITTADAIATQYAADGYSLTLRQLYYQFVARGLIANREQSYDRIGRLVSDGRMAGLIDWDHIVDRTRRWEYQPHWGSSEKEGAESAHAFIESVVPQFRTMKWDTQPVYVEIWVEKEALADVVKRPAERLDLSWFACRGYTSQSAQHAAAVRFVRHINAGQDAIILHLGDHDPSGIDMTRDIYDRINLFTEYHTGQRVEVKRLALNMDQVEQYDPPPNPAKMTDSRAGDYVANYGMSSWELDALDPPTIDGIITAAVEEVRDEAAWEEAVQREQDGQDLLDGLDTQWDDLVDRIREGME